MDEIQKEIEIKEKLESELSKDKLKKIIMIMFIILIIGIILVIAYMIYNSNISITDITGSIKKNITENTVSNNTITTNISSTGPCTERWTCTNWTTCSSNQQIRLCSDINNCNITVNKPVTERPCCSWECDDWSECYPANFKYRNCYIGENCNSSEYDKPETKIFCNFTGCTDTEDGLNYTVQGKITDKNGIVWEDECKDSINLVEIYCGRYGDIESMDYKCLTSCENGRCNQTIA